MINQQTMMNLPSIEDLLEEEEKTPTVMEQAFRPWMEILDAEKEKRDSEKDLDEIYERRVARWLSRTGRP